jgi:hypothetical protein
VNPLRFAALIGAAAAAPTGAAAAAPVLLLPALAFGTALLIAADNERRRDDALRDLEIAAARLRLERERATIAASPTPAPLTPDTVAVLELMKRVGPRRADLVPVGARYRLPSGQPLTRTRYNAAVDTLRAAGLMPT